MKVIDNIKMVLHELGQGKTQVKFAVVDPETGKTITPFCKCKDYFTDMFWSNKLKTKVNICGFKWEPNEDKGILDKEEFTIAIRLQEGANFLPLDSEQAKNLKSLLNKFEKKNKFKLSKTELSDDNRYVILTVSSKWASKPYLVSTLFFLIRLGFKYDGKTEPIEFFTKAKSGDYLSPYDEGYFRTSKSRLEDLLNGKIEQKQTYEMYTEHTIHSSSGLIGYRDYKIA